MTGRSDVQRYIESDVAVSYRHDAGYERRQRALDLAMSAAGLIVTFPILGLAALAIYFEDGGSPLFKQERIGQFGRRFTIYKLRTMSRTNCGDALSPTGAGDARVTRVGALLRRTSVDELPQLINVVRGDMALVGPRPEMPFVVERYEPWQHCRHLRKPGITGLWQISVRKHIPLHTPEATKIDLAYVRSASTRVDWQIVLGTFAALFKMQGAF